MCIHKLLDKSQKATGQEKVTTALFIDIEEVFDLICIDSLK